MTSPTKDPRSITGVIADFLADTPAGLAARQLHVAEPVWRFLRERYAATIRPEAASALLGMPVVIDDDLTGGQWQLHNGDQVVKSGDMAPAPDGMAVDYSPVVGWFAADPNLVEWWPA